MFGVPALSAESADTFPWTVKLRPDVKATFTRALAIATNPNRALLDTIVPAQMALQQGLGPRKIWFPSGHRR